MAFNASFSLAKIFPKNTFTLTDTSVGADPNLTTRTVSIYKADGTLLSSPINWPLADASITIAQISDDRAANISVFWGSSNPLAAPSTYTFAQISAFNANLEDFYGKLTQLQTSNPTIISDFTYYKTKMILRVEIDSSNQAIDILEDIYAAESCIQRGSYLVKNQMYYY